MVEVFQVSFIHTYVFIAFKKNYFFQKVQSKYQEKLRVYWTVYNFKSIGHRLMINTILERSLK